MIREQLNLWDDPKQIILEKEKVDLSTLRSPKTRRYPFSDLPADKFFIYKTGGINPWKPELGPIFPFVKIDTGTILSQTTCIKSSPYPHVAPSVPTPTKEMPNKIKNFKCYMHKIVALAFLENDDIENKIFVDHLDNDIYNYMPSNLEWVTPSENNRRRDKYKRR